MKKDQKHIGKLGSLHWFHWVIIVMSLVLTIIAWYFSQLQVDERRLALFNGQAKQVIELVQERMINYRDALSAGVATIQANGGTISYSKWKSYVENLNLIEKYPGINGLGVIYQVLPNQLNTYLKEQRIERPDYFIHPKHKESVYLPITYIIPVKGNEKAVGLDMAHESNRFKAALKAEDTGMVQITAPITLIQDQAKTPGFLFYAPFYRGGVYQTEQLRREHFAGMVYAPFIFKKLISGVLAKTKRSVGIKITDNQHILYDELNKDHDEYDAKTNYKFSKLIPMYGRLWSFDIWGSKSLKKTIGNTQPLTILIGGICIDILLLILFITISRSNKNAIEYANIMTAKLKEKTKTLEISNQQLTKTKEQLEKLAHYDIITNLPNRRSFRSYLEKAIARAKENQMLIAVCFLDLDNFKQVNDNIGHTSGDKLLKAIADLLKPKLRDVDYLARLSGDEFGLIIEQISSSDKAAKIVSHYLKTVNQTIEIDKHEVNLSVSIGIAMYPHAGRNFEELIKHADIAMYNAKESGKNTYRFFNDETNKQVKRRHNLEIALHKAIAESELSLAYQPQLDAQTNQIHGVEVLLRWENKHLGAISPVEFIPIAEETGIIDEIGRWITQQVAIDWAHLKLIHNNLKISINVSIRQLENKKFQTILYQLLDKYKLPYQNITLEVTETAVMRKPDLIIAQMNNLAMAGISFALDDFGIGYSSMSYLKKLPITYIKIDQSFVGDIEQDTSDAAIVTAIIQLSKSLGTKTIAEGVETNGEYTYLQQHGCDYLQGYCIDKPMPLAILVKKYRKKF